MNRRVLLKPRAEIDILDHEDYLFKQSPAAADRFVMRVATSARLLADRPGMGSPRHFESPESRGVRVWPVDGFAAYLIVYREVDRGIEVLRVLHAAQDVTQLTPEE